MSLFFFFGILVTLLKDNHIANLPLASTAFELDVDLTSYGALGL